jgi:hypothetical protein
MSSTIFPGMDPYLEDPQLWPGVHHRLIVYICDQLSPLLRPRYIAAIEERVYVEGPERDVIPDVWVRRRIAESPALRFIAEPTAVAVLEEDDEPLVVKAPGLEIHEGYITILDLHSRQQIVTVIEVVSPANKYAGSGRKSYETKQREVLASDANLVEIDLLRFGPHVLAIPEYRVGGKVGTYDYLVSVNRARYLREDFELYPCRLRKKLPRIRIPLAGNDPDVRLDLQAVLAHTYEAGSYDHRIDYRKPCVPPLPPDDQTWADQLIAQAHATSSE